MKTYLIALAALLIIGGGTLAYVTSQNTEDTAETAVAVAPGEKLWVEVIASHTTATSTSGARIALQTGDEIAAGYVVATDNTGVAIIHFPDGSFAKLDSNSVVTITEAAYDPASGATKVKMTLAAGGLWSKVLDLVGKDSSWEVETSNAVATVRGTAFAMFAQKGKTRVAGIEHRVSVAVRDAKTQKLLATEADVTEDTEITVDDTRVQAVASAREKLVVVPISREVSQSAEFKAFTARAAEFDTKRDTLRAQAASEQEFRKEFREERVKDFTEKILKTREERQEARQEEKVREEESLKQEQGERKGPAVEVRNSEDRIIQTKPVERTLAPVTKPADTKTLVPNTETIRTGVTGAADVRPLSLKVISDRDLKGGLTEGETATFRAVLFFSDQTKKDMTASVAWNVIGKIGTFTSPGTFRAEMALEVEEAPGAVYATYTGPGGKELNGASAAFSVRAFIPTTTDEAAG